MFKTVIFQCLQSGKSLCLLHHICTLTMLFTFLEALFKFRQSGQKSVLSKLSSSAFNFYFFRNKWCFYKNVKLHNNNFLYLFLWWVCASHLLCIVQCESYEAITHIIPLFIIVMAIRTKTKLLTNYYCYVSEKYEIRFRFQSWCKEIWKHRGLYFSQNLCKLIQN